MPFIQIRRISVSLPANRSRSAAVIAMPQRYESVPDKHAQIPGRVLRLGAPFDPDASVLERGGVDLGSGEIDQH